MFVCDKAFESQAKGLMAENAIVPVKTQVISAGKFRRYRHLTFWQHLTIPAVVWGNFRDLFKVGWGTLQSVVILMKFCPDVVFAKGGYVCLPIGIAAHLLRIPLVIHDSDARPGLTNSIIGRWATKIGTGSPLENYSYPADKAHYVGVPIDSAFHPYSSEEQISAKQTLGFDPAKPLVVVTGGGLGAVTINHAMTAIGGRLLESGVNIYHVAGKKNYEATAQAAPHDAGYVTVPFVFKDMSTVLGAADIVVSRASATFAQELAGLAKSTILIPSRALSDQRKNAEVYKDSEAAIVLTDDDIANPDTLYGAISSLLQDAALRSKLAHNLHTFSRPNAAADVAELVVSVARR